MAELDNFSRLLRTQQIIFQEKETFGSWSSFPWLEIRPSDESISTFYVTSALAGRPDLIANQIYGSSLLDWVLISFNSRVGNDETAAKGLNWPKAGQTIEYPAASLVMSSLLN
jgi:hypothetical protein